MDIQQILSKLAGKTEAYEKKEYLPSVRRVSGQSFHTRSELSKHLLKDPQLALGILLSNGFARGGAEQANYGEIASKALEQEVTGRFNRFIKQTDAPVRIWEKFVSICTEEWKGTNEKLNKGVIHGLVTLASQHGNVMSHLKEEISDDLEQAFIHLNTIHGIGPKVASLLLRDTAWLYDLENKIPPEYRIYLQPVDRWIRRIARCMWTDLDNEAVPDWVIAKRITDACNRYGISPIHFNQGAWYFGAREVRDEKRLCDKINQL